jgi:putative transposase
MTEVLPLLYLHGLSTGDLGPALEQFLSSGAGLSATTITRLTAQWQDEAKSFGQRDLSGTDYVYLWADGIHLKVRLEQEKLCLLVMIGVRANGRKELVALADGYRVVHRVVGRSAAFVPPPRHDRPGAGRRRWCARVLECRARSVPDHP